MLIFNAHRVLLCTWTEQFVLGFKDRDARSSIDVAEAAAILKSLALIASDLQITDIAGFAQPERSGLMLLKRGGVQDVDGPRLRVPVQSTLIPDEGIDNCGLGQPGLLCTSD